MPDMINHAIGTGTSAATRARRDPRCAAYHAPSPASGWISRYREFFWRQHGTMWYHVVDKAARNGYELQCASTRSLAAAIKATASLWSVGQGVEDVSLSPDFVSTGELAEVGFAITGTGVQRSTRCGTPDCRCRTDPPRPTAPTGNGPRRWPATPSPDASPTMRPPSTTNGSPTTGRSVN